MAHKIESPQCLNTKEMVAEFLKNAFRPRLIECWDSLSFMRWRRENNGDRDWDSKSSMLEFRAATAFSVPNDLSHPEGCATDRRKSSET